MPLIAVGIPSYNEANSISDVVRSVDQGLIGMYLPENCVIVNIDSDSSDGTPARFLSTPTRCAKVSIVVQDRPRGKGRNILQFLQYCEGQGITALALVDADIVTMTPEWMLELLGPITKDEADFVIPYYRRSRFEGSTTNHFVYPLVFGWYGRNLRQPIGGDFGLSRAFASHLLRQPISLGVLGYGIDIFLTLHAVTNNWRIGQADLGRKVHNLHNPGYRKIVNMFPEIAEAALEPIRTYPLQYDIKPEGMQQPSIEEGIPFLHRAEGVKLRRRMHLYLPKLRPAYRNWLSGRDDILDEMWTSGTLRTEGWSLLFSAAVRQVARSASLSILDIALLLRPAFIMRAVSFWEDSVDWLSEVAEAEIIKQAQLVRALLVDSKQNAELDPTLVRIIAQELRAQEADYEGEQ